MTLKPTLLPSNATPLERAFEQMAARVAEVPTPIRELWNPQTCPLELLPWLAWALSTDRWDPNWNEDQKRTAVAQAIEVQRTKGTPAAIDKILAAYDPFLTLLEWFEMEPRGDPYTFAVTLPLVTPDGATGGPRATAAFADAIIHDVIRAKPARAHFEFRQTAEGAGTVRALSVGRGAGFMRIDCAADETNDPVWSTYLTTETGEPLQLEDGSEFLEAA